MGTNSPWNWILTVLKIMKMTVRADCALSACNPLFQSVKALAHWLGGRSQPLDRCPHSSPPCQLLTSRIKQSFFSTNLAYLFTFEQRAVRPHFWFEGYQLDEEISTIPATEGKYSLSTHLSLFPQHNNLEVRTQGFEPCNVFLPLPFSSLPHRHTPSSRSHYLPTKLLQFLLN